MSVEMTYWPETRFRHVPDDVKPVTESLAEA